MLLSLCTDIDECKLNKCEKGCNNSVGSYQCTCSYGYQVAADGHHCEGILNFESLIQPDNETQSTKLEVIRAKWPSLRDMWREYTFRKSNLQIFVFAWEKKYGGPIVPSAISIP